LERKEAMFLRCINNYGGSNTENTERNKTERGRVGKGGKS